MFSIRSLSTVLIIFCLFWSCKKDSSKKSQLPEPSEMETEVVATQDSEPTIVKTSSGKSVQIITVNTSSSMNDIKIIPNDFSQSRDTFFLKEVDPLQEILIGDLDKNGFEEIYLITTASGSGSYAAIYGFASNQDLSMTPVYVPEISEKDLLPDGKFYGYMGHDSIYTTNNRIYRKYPIYKEGDANCCPSGGDKTISYYLKAGEASWILAIEN